MEALSVKIIDWNPGDLIDQVKFKMFIDPNLVREMLAKAIQDGIARFEKEIPQQILTATAQFESTIEVRISYKTGSVDVSQYVKKE